MLNFKALTGYLRRQNVCLQNCWKHTNKISTFTGQVSTRIDKVLARENEEGAPTGGFGGDVASSTS